MLLVLVLVLVVLLAKRSVLLTQCTTSEAPLVRLAAGPQVEE